jgi:2-dehydropantoate 2-reductase
MKICIYGAGAIGGYLAVLLEKTGADLSVIARGAQLEAIKENGLTLLRGEETLHAKPRAAASAAELGPQDYVIVALKAHQAWETAEAMRPLFGPDTAVVTAQNGVPWWYFYGLDEAFAGLRLQSVDPSDRQWKAIGPERVIGATVYPATEVVSPGVIKHIYGDTFGLGEPNRTTTTRLTRLAEAFTAAGLKARVYEDIRDDIWIKLWGNLCFNPISALTPRPASRRSAPASNGRRWRRPTIDFVDAGLGDELLEAAPHRLRAIRRRRIAACARPAPSPSGSRRSRCRRSAAAGGRAGRAKCRRRAAGPR